MKFKLLAVFFILLMLNITPACALNIEEVQNDVDVMKKDAEYLDKYSHSNIGYRIKHITTALAVCNHIKEKWYGDTKNKVENVINELTENNIINEEKSAQEELLNYYNNKENSNSISKKVPKALTNDAKEIQNQLQKEGINLNIVNVDFSDLKNGAIVQVIKKADENVYVRYYTYEGITDSGKVKVYNGQKIKEVDPLVFKGEYTGLTFEGGSPLNIKGNYDPLELLTAEIFRTKSVVLSDKIQKHEQKIRNLNRYLAIFLLMLLLIGPSLCLVAGLFICFVVPLLFGLAMFFVGGLITAAGFLGSAITNAIMKSERKKVRILGADKKDLLNG